MKYPKANIVRSESYRRWVASLPCIACGYEGASQAAHANFGKGLGMKTSDLTCFPLCGPHGYHQGCHVVHDQCIGMTRDERRELEAKYIERMHALAVEHGRKEFKQVEAA
jgi:hypothetical protein